MEQDVQHVICPHCFETQDSALNSEMAEDQKPKTGSLSMCTNCAGLSIYDEKMQLRELNEAEKADIAADDELQRHLAMMESVVVLNNADYLSRRKKSK